MDPPRIPKRVGIRRRKHIENYIICEKNNQTNKLKEVKTLKGKIETILLKAEKKANLKD